jgi:hypothetical protein
MIKKSLLILGILFLIFPLISAVQVESKQQFNQGETFLAQVSGNFLDKVVSENIYFYRGGNNRVSLDVSVVEIQDEYYIYTSLLEKVSGNYSMIIKDTEYMQGVQVSGDEIVFDFEILETQADFSVLPGTIKTSDNFSVEIQNLQNYKINLEVLRGDFSKEQKGFFASLFGEQIEETSENTFELKSGETINIDFELANKTGLETIGFKTENQNYTLPVYMIVEEVEEPEEGTKDLDFEFSELNVTLPTNSNKIRFIYLFNNGEEDLFEVNLTLSKSLEKYINLSETTISFFDANESEKIQLNILQNVEEEIIEGQLRAESGEIVAFIDIYLSYVKDYIPIDDINITNETKKVSLKTCEEENGTICEQGTKCDKKSFTAKDGVCCPSECVEKKTSSTGKIIGWVVIVSLILLYIWFYFKRYKRTKKRKIDLLEVAKGKRKSIFKK